MLTRSDALAARSGAPPLTLSKIRTAGPAPRWPSPLMQPVAPSAMASARPRVAAGQNHEIPFAAQLHQSAMIRKLPAALLDARHRNSLGDPRDRIEPMRLPVRSGKL